MISSEIQHLLDLADESHEIAKELIKKHVRFSAAQSYYTVFYLAEALLLTKGLAFSSHSAVVAAFGKEFAKTGLLDSKLHQYLIETQKRRQVGHYGDIGEELTAEDARECFEWADEFMQAAKRYLKR